MNKLLKIMMIIMLALCMIITITGCGNKEVDNNQEAKEEKREFSMGEWKDNVYENDFLGFKFTIPDGWNRLTEEEIAEEMELAKELVSDLQKLSLEASKLQNAYFLVASDEKTGENIRIISEKPLIDATTEDYIDAVKSGLKEAETIKYEEVGVTKEKVGNIDCDVLTEKGSYLGVSILQKYYIYKVDDYFITIIVTTSSDESRINEIMNNFQ